MIFDMNLWEKNSNIRLLTRAVLLLCRAGKLCQKNNNLQRGFAEKDLQPPAGKSRINEHQVPVDRSHRVPDRRRISSNGNDWMYNELRPQYKN
jgi:hypothetical protein